MSDLEKFNKPFGIKNYINTCVEFFPAPLPEEDPEFGDEKFVEPIDLFQSSRGFDFEPIFIPPSGDITICDLDLDSFELVPDTDQTVSGKEFLKFQLQKININTLIQLPTRVDFGLSDELITNLLKEMLDPEIEVDDWGYPKDESKYPYWLNHTDNIFNIHKPEEEQYVKDWEETLTVGRKFLEEFRISHANLLIDPMVDAILNDDWGIYNHWGEAITDLASTRHSYSNWNCPLMVMYSGKMWPQYSKEGWPKFHSPTCNISDVYVRNNDEGDPI
tara:strand:- start:129 stop:953 length:825 start_codon:yes stop_codon:yes gene_type:complete